MDDADIGRVLLPGCPCKIRSGIGTPVTKKGNDSRFKFCHVFLLTSCWSSVLRVCNYQKDKFLSTFHVPLSPHPFPLPWGERGSEGLVNRLIKNSQIQSFFKISLL